MKPEHRSHLQKRGWNEQEIRRAENILDAPKDHDRHFSKIVFWSALVVIIIANILVSLILIPFLVALKSWVLYAVMALLGLAVGSLYKFLVTDIGHLESRHHLAASIIIPLVAFANFVVMVIVSNKFITDIGAETPPHNPWIAGAVFAVVLMLPYVAGKVKERMFG